MKKIILLALLLPCTSFSYTNFNLLCRVNGGIGSRVSCDNSWVKMITHSQIKLRLSSCLRSKNQQVLEVKIDNVTYKPGIPQDFEVEARVGGYLVECIAI